jgi:hypothetical protein
MDEQQINCKAVGCKKLVAPSQVLLRTFMCTQCWNLVPEQLKNLLTARYEQAGENDDYNATVFVVISVVANQQKKPLPTLASEIPVVQEPLLQGVTPYPD